MASSKSSTSDKRRSTVKEKEYRESSRNRTSGHSRDLSKSRNEKTHKSEKSHSQDKHRISSHDMPRQNARTTSSSKVESARGLEEKLSRTTKKVTEIVPVKDSNANLNTKLLDQKLKSRKVESITSNRSKATLSKSRSTLKSNPNENVNSKSVLKSSSRTVKETATNKLDKLESTTNKSRKLESNELSKKIKTLTTQYPTFDIENDEQSDVEDDYPDDFENYDSDFEDSSGEDDEIEEKKQEIIQPSNAPLPVKTLQSDDLQSSAVPPMVSDIAEPQNLTVSKPIRQSIKDAAVVSNRLLDQGNTNIIERQHGQQVAEEKNLALPKYSSKSYINFNAAKKNLQAQKVISKIKKRGDVLLDLITLDETPIDLFSLPPTAYDEFMVTFAGANTKQAYIQTGDDNVLEESQTDPIEMLDLWTQYPPYIGGAIGGEFMSKINKPVEVSGIKDWKRLSNFLNVASRVICSILEEDQIGLHDSVNNGTKGKYDFSERVSHMDQQNHLQSKGICSAYSITCSKLQPHILLSACEELPMKKDDDSFQNQMLICVWNIFQPTSPQKLLMCRYAVPLSCCLDDQANFAFAGMHDASVALWDLREPDSLHKREVYDDNQWLSLRTPTYVTAGSNSVESHNSSVIAIRCQQDSYNSNNFSNKSLAGNKNSQGIIQLATLDEEAQIFIWVVTELLQPVLDWEHGLSPNGHVKLSKSLVINLQTLQTAQQYLKTYPRALNFITDPNDSSSFYVATDLGTVISCSLYGGKCKVYGNSIGHIAEATSLDFLWMEKSSYFLAGYNDGSIILYSAKKEKALMIWKIDGSKGVVKVQWSKSTPNIFYVLHIDGKMCIWDLKRNDRKPVTSISQNSKRIIGFDVGNDKRVQNSSVTNYQPLIVLGYDDGTVEAHYLTLQYSRSGPEEMEFFRQYIEYL